MADFGWAEALDAQVALAVQTLATPGLHAFMEGLSVAHGPRGIAVLTAAVAAMLFVGRRRADALWLLLTVFGGAALNHLLKHSIQRPRPGMEHLDAVATDFSFPSGHAANTTLLYGALALLLIRHVRTAGLRALAAAFAASAVLLVSSSRLVLGDAFADRSLLDGEFDEFFLQPLHRSREYRDATIRLLRSFDYRHVRELGELHRRIDVPVQLVWGEHDRFFPVKWAEEMVGTFPDARLEVIEGAGLFAHEERPAEVARALLPALTAPR